jgi:hypothetical protein
MLKELARIDLEALVKQRSKISEGIRENVELTELRRLV